MDRFEGICAGIRRGGSDVFFYSDDFWGSREMDNFLCGGETLDLPVVNVMEGRVVSVKLPGMGRQISGLSGEFPCWGSCG